MPSLFLFFSLRFIASRYEPRVFVEHELEMHLLVPGDEAPDEAQHTGGSSRRGAVWETRLRQWGVVLPAAAMGAWRVREAVKTRGAATGRVVCLVKARAKGVATAVPKHWALLQPP